MIIHMIIPLLVLLKIQIDKAIVNLQRQKIYF